MFTVTYFYLVPLAPILDKCVPFLFLLLLFCTDIYVQCDGVGGDIYVSHIGICHPKGKGFALLWSENGYRQLIFMWNRVWFSRELRECTNVFFKFIVSIPNE